MTRPRNAARPCSRAVVAAEARPPRVWAGESGDHRGAAASLQSAALQAHEFLTTSEVADLLKCSASTLVRLRQRGEGPPAFWVGASPRYALADVLTWVSTQTGRLR